MTKPDEALLWARDAAWRPWVEDPEYCRQVQAGDWDNEPVVEWRAQAYRAGAAASEARIKALEEKNAAFAKRIKALKGAIDQLLSAYEHLDSYEVKSTELWAAYHFALNIYDDFVWSPEENAEEADQ